MSGTTLYVVDMQPGYTGSLNIIDEVIREIRLAKRRKDIIAFVTLSANSGYGNTHPELIDAAKAGGYKRVLYTTKLGGDGSQELMALMDSVRTPIKRVRVCGVNRSACVWNTVYGLTNVLPPDAKIEVACDATSDSVSKKWDHRGFQEMEYAKLAVQGKIKLLLPSSSG
jgi:hypothetical protein